MAKALDFPGANRLFTAPKGHEDTIGNLSVFANGKSVVSAWQLTEEEWEKASATRTVFVSIQSGLQLFPMFVGEEDEVRRVVADTGPVWPTADRVCFNPSCAAPGTHFPVIRFGPAERLPGGAIPYRLEVPQAACLQCQAGFNAAVFFTDQARKNVASAIAADGKPEPDFSRLIVTWHPLDDPVWAELKGGGEARFWY